MNKLSRVLTLIGIITILFGLTESANAQEYSSGLFYNPDMPVLKKDIIIEVATINDKLNDHDGFPLSESTGRVYLPPSYFSHDGRSHGIYVVSTIQGPGLYFAFEARCPKCKYRDNKKGTMIFTDTHFASCNRCGTRAEQMTWVGSGQCQQQDGDELLEIYYLDSYLTEAFKNNGKWYVRIYNNPITTEKPDPRYELPKPTEPFRYPGT